MSTKSKARTAASGMGHRAHGQGAGHGAAQLTFDDEEAEDDRVEEGGLHTGGARTHLACCGRLRANPIQLQLPRKPLLARRLETAAMPCCQRWKSCAEHGCRSVADDQEGHGAAAG